MRIFNVLLTAILHFFNISMYLEYGEYFQSKQEVTIESMPFRFRCLHGWRTYRKTPMVLSLRSDISHEINFQKEGFKSTSEYLDPIFKDDKTPYVQFGLAKDLGYYYQLSSDYIISELDWESLPNSVGIMPFETMSELITEADHAKFSGTISEEEHKIIMRQIVELFN